MVGSDCKLYITFDDWWLGLQLGWRGGVMRVSGILSVQYEQFNSKLTRPSAAATFSSTF